MMEYYVLGGSWCCTSWYKPSGSINYATPEATPSLPAGCGLASSVAAGADGSGAPPDAPERVRKDCQRVQAIRRQSQMPYEFVYQLADGKDGIDGYYRLKKPEVPFGGSAVRPAVRDGLVSAFG